MDLQPIYNIAEICSQHGISQAVLSPGSRCAPLTLAFTRHPKIACRTITDERSAAFIGMGIAQQLKKPTILVCTSGSAAYNYAPAIAEAFFQRIPLLVFTADRPPEWIDQLDGQTIRQEGIYGQHIKHSYNIPADLSHQDAQWHTMRIISEAINKANEYPAGPVHINIPFREPFYAKAEEQITYEQQVKVITETYGKQDLAIHDWNSLADAWKQFKRILIVGGQNNIDSRLSTPLNQIIQERKVPVVGDIISNLHGIEEIITHSDLFLGQDKNGLHQSLQPDLLITFGNSTISKNLKTLLRNNPPEQHWHIQEAGYVADTYKALTRIIRLEASTFFKKMAGIELPDSFDNLKQENYYQIWQIEERKSKRLLETFFPYEPFGEFEFIKEVINNLPDYSNLHLANSMAVRYANFIGLHNDTIEVFANRGTSGIDGSNSTTVGHCFSSERLNILITGDLAFFYDRNAFWHNYPLSNLRIILVNNHAGGIFRIINGPDKLPELEQYFETHQALTGKNLCEEFGFEYLHCNKRSKLKNYLKDFFTESDTAKIMELETISSENTATLKAFKNTFKDIK